MNNLFSAYSFALVFITISSHALAQVPSTPIARINSPYDERSPIMSSDGKTLYFTISNHPNNLGGKQDKGDIWISTWNGKAWTTPVNGGPILNNIGYNAVGGISRDGHILYLFGHYGLEGNTKKQHVAISRKDPLSTWSIPNPISIPYFPTRSATLSGYVSPDESIIIFAGTSYDTYGAEDIYICKKTLSGRWEEPQNIGKPINTPYQEFSPWLSEDMKYLYFASNGHDGYGSFDIYRSTRLNDGWTTWSTPINMGSKINSEGRELFYSEYLKKGKAIYTTTLNSDGYGDVRETLPGIQDAPPTPEDSLHIAKKVDNKDSLAYPLSWLEIRGDIMEKGSGKPIVAVINFYDEIVVESTSDSNGAFSVKMPARSTYHIQITASGYMSETKEIHPPVSGEWVAHFKLNPIRVGTTIKLENVFFKRGTATLLESSFVQLNRIVMLLKNNPDMEIALAGHTDNRGNRKQNLKLSQDRVDAVKKYVVNMGIGEKRISGRGYGGTKPIADNNNEATRKLNRRVEFTITKN